MKTAYVVSFLMTLVAVVALMAPTVYHRLRWRERNKERMLRAANLSTIIGMTALAVAMTAGVFLVIDSVVSQGWAIVMTIAAAVVFVGLWLVVAPHRAVRPLGRAPRRGRSAVRARTRRAASSLARRLALEDRASVSASMLPPETMQTTRPAPPWPASAAASASASGALRDDARPGREEADGRGGVASGTATAPARSGRARSHIAGSSAFEPAPSTNDGAVVDRRRGSPAAKDAASGAPVSGSQAIDPRAGRDRRERARDAGGEPAAAPRARGPCRSRRAARPARAR